MKRWQTGFVMLALVGGTIPSSFGAINTLCGSCTADRPPLCDDPAPAHDGCGNSCGYISLYDPCPVPPPVCNPGDTGPKTSPTGFTTTCSKPCGGVTIDCTPLPPPPPLPPSSWVPYGTAFPGHPHYGFDLPTNDTRTLLGLSAKGNIVLGDYTWDSDGDSVTDFEERGVLAMLQPYDAVSNPGGKTQPYQVDPSDAALGYESYTSSGRPFFDGDYTKVDTDGTGKKLRGGGDRRFYESSLPDNEFQNLVDPDWRIDPTKGQPYDGMIDAVLYTNHALTGFMPQRNADFFGSVVARDDAMAFTGRYLELWHDIRLLSGNSAVQVSLPMDLHRSELTEWKECAPSGCDP